ncbi:hypothetical protein LAUMK35_04231 [Mycobacterium pseudokansasii]|nr:hypothetical protein LAUMK35_04231 [Mycobacterium pseudokansasii]VBA30315.1 hypothetical protein LAUMK21_04226 [Mycobacterium pseudokansasii]
MGNRVPPPVSALPVAASRSLSVVVTMMLAGRPLCWPSSPLASKPRRPASRPSWLRWPSERVSRCAASSGAGPSTTGLSSCGLHMPGAASLANTASRLARASGVSQPLMRDIPSRPCLPRLRPRRRALSSSVKVPSGLRQSISRCASLANWSGLNRVASRARWASAFSRVSRSTPAGSWRKKSRITRSWAAPMRPSRCAAAVALSCGANGSPVNARRSPSSVASATRRLASARVIRNRVANAEGNLPPSSSSLDCSAIWLISECSMLGS